MGVTTRFAVEYPRRCLELIAEMEGAARNRQLVGSFALLAAAAVLTIPFERMRAKHFLHRRQDRRLPEALKQLSKTRFTDAPFLPAEEHKHWRQSRIFSHFDDVDAWRDGDGRHPLAPDARNLISDYPITETIRAIRNALAHGNIVHLDADGREREGNRLQYLAMLSRYEEGAAQATAESYRVIVTTEEAFLSFVKGWAEWVSELADHDREIVAVETSTEAEPRGIVGSFLDGRNQ
jgi:hypothetical protein